MSNQKLIDYLRAEQRHNAWEQQAMSRADFSRFLEGLLDIIDPPKPVSPDDEEEA